MAAGGPDDHSLTDLLCWGKHPFPKELEELVLAIAAITPEALHDTKLRGAKYWDWQMATAWRMAFVFCKLN